MEWNDFIAPVRDDIIGFELFPTTAMMAKLVQDDPLGNFNIANIYSVGFGREYAPICNGEDELAGIDPSWYYHRSGGPLPHVTIYWFT